MQVIGGTSFLVWFGVKGEDQMAMGSLLEKVQSHMMPSPFGRWLDGKRTRVTQ